MELRLPLHPKQRLCLTSPAQQILYGGAAGGGKSHTARVIAIYLCMAIPGIQVFLFRRTCPQLKLSHYIGPNSFQSMLSEAINKGFVEVAALEVRFKNGSTIHGCHCQYEQDVLSYKSAEMHATILEEATEFTPYQIRYLGTRSRFPKNLNVPAELKHKLPFTLYPTNPGGESHDYFLEQFRVIDENGKSRLQPSEVWKANLNDGGKTRQFIPAQLEDNPDIDIAEYEGNIFALRNPDEVRALRYGDWTVKLGALLPELTSRRHVIPHFDPPSHWTRVQAHDWGSNAPAATVWAAISDGEFQGLPRGAVYIYKEWLIAETEDKSKGLGYSNKQIAEGMYQREDTHRGAYLTDTLPFQERGGVPMWKDYEDCGIHLKQADVSDKSVSVQAVRSLAVGIDNVPMLYFSEDCPDVFRCLQALRPHLRNPEKPADHKEDHLPDCVFHIAREWTSVTDMVKTDKEIMNKKIKEQQDAPVNLTSIIEDFNIMLDFGD